LAPLVTADGEVPLFHHAYAGNQHDAKTFERVIERLLERCRCIHGGVRANALNAG
jgi:transposase